MRERMMPEQACIEIMSEIKQFISPSYVISIEPGGSVPLGTYVENPDIDIFILSRRIQGVMRDLRVYFPNGKEKKGELDIWHIPKYKGYPVDLVVLDPDHVKIQTLDHTRYYMDIMTEELRERIKALKRFFKKINCYGAEVGGITGICCTRLAELYDNMWEAIDAVCVGSINRHFIVEDPTLPGRDLFASMTIPKRMLLLRLGVRDPPFPDVDLQFMFDNYDRVYGIRRKKKLGTDIEYQFVTRCVNRAWGTATQRIRDWKPKLDYDTMFTPNIIYLGISVTPDKLTSSVSVKIKREKIPQEGIDSLKKKYKVTITDEHVIYEKFPPFKNVMKAYEEALYNRLYDKYIEVERV